MMVNGEKLPEADSWLTIWGQDRALAGCTHCNGVFVLPTNKANQRCPFCGQSALAEMHPGDDRPVYTQPPELTVPFQVGEDRVRASAAQFAKGIWLAPADLNENSLLARLQPLYLPMWLVDAQVRGEWQAEMGFDYEIVSHREQFHNGRWQTERVKEGRVRWEPRLGRLDRTYSNLTAPALEEQAEVERQIGRFDQSEAQSFQPVSLSNAVVGLPNRPPADAWTEAEASLKTAAAQDCRLACEADHARGFKWSPTFAGQQWTQLLLPVYTSYYLDDEGRPHMVLLHGQTGRLHGVRRASRKKARRLSGIILAGTAVLLLAALILLLLGFWLDEAALPWAGLLGVIAVGLGGTAVLPLLYVWFTNNRVDR